MKIVELDAKNWTTILDFYDAILHALGAPEDHGRNLNALLDSMIWTDKINELKTPYCIRILLSETIPKDIREEIQTAEQLIDYARIEHRKWCGDDIEVRFETIFNH